MDEYIGLLDVNDSLFTIKIKEDEFIASINLSKGTRHLYTQKIDNHLSLDENYQSFVDLIETEESGILDQQILDERLDFSSVPHSFKAISY